PHRRRRQASPRTGTGTPRRRPEGSRPAGARLLTLTCHVCPRSDHLAEGRRLPRPAHRGDMTYVTPHIGPARYVAVDLETTGLGEDAHLLEISALILDAQLRERASYTTLVHHPAGALNRLDEKVREMHTASGLLADLADATGLPTV